MKTALERSASPVPPEPPPAHLPGSLAALSPAYFGMAMATGIVSLAAHLLGMRLVAQALFRLNVVIYAALWVLSLLRLIRHPRRMLGDLLDHLRAPGFFTTVAATSVLASQFVLLSADYRTATLLWALALALWVALTYTIFAALTLKESKPTLERGINGAWLLAVVATQSIAVLSTLLAAKAGGPHRLELNFLALSMWLWGGMLYIWMMALIFYRYTFFALSPLDLTPPYWINMGAMAISTLAGSLLVLGAPNEPFLLPLLPFIKGFTVFYWATGTWWIPMLLALGVWRYVMRRFPLRYDVLYWGAVFPIGMYAAATHQMIEALGLPFLRPLPPAFLYVGLAAWAAAFIGLALELLRRIGSRPASGAQPGAEP